MWISAVLLLLTLCSTKSFKSWCGVGIARIKPHCGLQYSLAKDLFSWVRFHLEQQESTSKSWRKASSLSLTQHSSNPLSSPSPLPNPLFLRLYNFNDWNIEETVVSVALFTITGEIDLRRQEDTKTMGG